MKEHFSNFMAVWNDGWGFKVYVVGMSLAFIAVVSSPSAPEGSKRATKDDVSIAIEESTDRILAKLDILLAR